MIPPIFASRWAGEVLFDAEIVTPMLASCWATEVPFVAGVVAACC